MPSDHRLPRCFCKGVDSEDSVETRAARGLCLVSEWHVRDIFVPNPNRIHVCEPPPPRFLARRAPGGQWRRWGGWRSLAGGGEIFDLSIFVFDGPETRYGVRQLWQNKPHLEKRRFRRVPADSRLFVGGDRTPWCGVRPSVHWQMRGRPSQHRAGLPPGAAHRREATVVFACSPPPDSQPPPGLHGRNCAAASASLENERAARATVRSRAQRRRAKPAGRSSA